jgi:hypothetical protein
MSSRLEQNPIRNVQLGEGALFLCDVCSGAWPVDGMPFHNVGCTYRDCPGCGEPVVGAGLCEVCRDGDKGDAPRPSDTITLRVDTGSGDRLATAVDAYLSTKSPHNEAAMHSALNDYLEERTPDPSRVKG